MAKHNELGEKGEKFAADYLQCQGYTIMARDERIGHFGELDIVALKDTEIVFVEVKTRTEPDTDPMDVVGSKSRARICRAANAIIEHYAFDLLPRFDIIIVNVVPGQPFRLTHYPDAFFPPISR